MTNHLLFTILISLTFSYSQGQELKYGVINDSDGYTNVRSQPDINSDVILKFHNYEIFQYREVENSHWFIVKYYPCDFDKNYIQKYDPYKEKVGYIHKSRITNLNNLDPTKYKLVVSNLIDTEIQQYKMIDSNERANHDLSNCKRISYHEFIFSTNLDLIKDLICQSRDVELFQKYLELLIVESGSADELPRFTLGEIYICLPDWTTKIMENYPSLIYDLEWGVVPYIYGKNDKESLKHKKRLNELREKFNLEKVDYNKYK